MNKAMWGIVAGVVLMLAAAATPVWAARQARQVSSMAGEQPARVAVPGLPHAFYGSVTVEGLPAPAGAAITVRGLDVLVGVPGNPIAVNSASIYGGSGVFEPKLLAQGNVTDGMLLEFYVDSQKAQCALPGGPWRDNYPFTGGEVTELNLRTLPSTLTPTPAPTNTPTVSPNWTPTATPPPWRQYLPVIIESGLATTECSR